MGRKKLEARSTVRWEPKTWKPRYDLIVYKHCLGYDNNRIAQELEINHQTISNILVSLQGRARIKIIQEKLLSNIDADISSRLHNVAEKFMRKIERVAEDEELFVKSPFAVIDRGLSVIKGIGHLRNTGEADSSGGNARSTVNTYNNTIIGKAVVMSEEAARGLREAIALSDEAREMHENRPFALLKGSDDAKEKTA